MEMTPEERLEEDEERLNQMISSDFSRVEHAFRNIKPKGVTMERFLEIAEQIYGIGWCDGYMVRAMVVDEPSPCPKCPHP